LKLIDQSQPLLIMLWDLRSCRLSFWISFSFRTSNIKLKLADEARQQIAYDFDEYPFVKILHDRWRIMLWTGNVTFPKTSWNIEWQRFGIPFEIIWWKKEHQNVQWSRLLK
jgi:hypothetical protein